MGKTDDDRLGRLVEELINDVGSDRERLSDFLDSLISMVGKEEVNAAQIAEFVAKIAAELTRQNQVKVATIKALGKNIPQDGPDDDDGISNEIGRPFPEDEEDLDEGSN